MKPSRERDEQRHLPQHMEDRLGSRQPRASALDEDRRHDRRYEGRASRRHEDVQYHGSEQQQSRHDRVADESRADRYDSRDARDSAVPRPRLASRVERAPRRAESDFNDRWTGQYESDSEQRRGRRHTAKPSNAHKHASGSSESSGSDSDSSSSRS